LLQEKKHQPWESQLALASEILRPHSMTRQKVLIAQLSAQSFDQSDEVMGNVKNSSLHPHGNGGGTAEPVQAKSFINSMSQLIQWVCIAEGEVFLSNGVRLRIREELDFEAGLITAYGYEVYQGENRLFWYDDFPHPNDSALTSTFPYHKHVPPDIRHHRIPAPAMSFTRPNLPALLEAGEALGAG
jgi:hypothetical protein